MVLLAGMLGCAGSAAPEADAPERRQHLIPVEAGLALLQRGADSAHPGRAEAVAPRAGRYAADAFLDVIEQPGATALVVMPGPGRAGLSLGVLDATGRWLPDGLAAGEVTPVAAWDGGFEAPREVVAKAREPIAYYWYDAAQAREFARSGLAAVDIALGETLEGESTPVILGVEETRNTVGDDAQLASRAFDNGYPCPPYCLQEP